MYKENLLTKEQNGVEMSKSPISGFFFLFLERKIMLTLEINKNEVERARLVKEANVPVFLCTAKFLGGGVLGSIFAGYVPLASPNLYPIIVYSVANYRPHVSHFWANILQIPTCQNLLTPEIPQMCNPILVTLLAPIENATPL